MGKLFHPLDDSRMIAHGNDLTRAHLPRDLKRKRPARDRNHLCTRIADQSGEQRSHKPDSDNGDGVIRLDIAPTKDIHGAT